MVHVKEQDYIRWVSRRAECTPEAILSLFRKRIEEDVDQINKVFRKAGHRFVCEVKPGDLESFAVVKLYEVEGDSGQDEPKRKPIHTVLFETKDNDEIVVKDKKGKTDTFTFMFMFRHKWNQDEAVCEFLVDTKPMTIWQINQKALLGLFFD